jgi:hypothetical protein
MDDSVEDPEPSQLSAPVTQKQQLSVDEIASVVPSESATPPPTSPSMLTTEEEHDEPDQSIEYPPERPTIEIPSAEAVDEGQDGSTLTPRPEDESNKKPSIALSVAQAPEHSSADEDKEEIDEEQEEILRKQRIAEKMARLGAVNPLSPGGFISPVSPHSAEKDKNESERHEQEVKGGGEESEALKAAQLAKTSNVDDESKANVPVLSSVLSSQTHSAETEINSPAAEISPLSSSYRREQGEAMSNDYTASALDAEADHEGSVEDADVDYPMLSPVEASEPGTQMPSSMNTLEAEVEPRDKGPARSSSQHGDMEG